MSRDQTQPIPLLVRGDTRTMLEADTANEVIRTLNNVVSLRVEIVYSGNSRIEIARENAVLVISTKDIDLGSIDGSKGGNNALTSLISCLKNIFTVRDSTT